jgi:2-oxoglutarate ferredoxin oxidoreductase subunit beta
MPFAYMLTRMNQPEYPVPIGVFRSVDLPTYDEQLTDQIRDARERFGDGDLEKLLNSGETWTVE